ncbi:uncharacterized protein TNCV_793631 [Trichonephila clavipes]|nr:uncharacterized protein TNCV_793631 [Trichonephila clavipes]
MSAVDFLHQENPPNWAGTETATLGTEGQRQANYATLKYTHGQKKLAQQEGALKMKRHFTNFHSAAVLFPRVWHHSKRRRRWVGVKGSTRNGCHDPKCPSAMREDTGAANESANCAWKVADEKQLAVQRLNERRGAEVKIIEKRYYIENCKKNSGNYYKNISKNRRYSDRIPSFIRDPSSAKEPQPSRAAVMAPSIHRKKQPSRQTHDAIQPSHKCCLTHDATHKPSRTNEATHKVRQLLTLSPRIRNRSFVYSLNQWHGGSAVV